MQFVTHPDMVYDFPIWAVAAAVIGSAVLAAVVLELLVRFAVPLDRRRAQNDVAAAMFSVVGVLYAVLLAFIAMMVWEGFNAAKAASYKEAAAIIDVWHVAAGVADPAGTALRDATHDYARVIVQSEWPAQARGDRAGAAAVPLDALHRVIASYVPATPRETNLHASLLAAVTHLEDARGERLYAAQSTMPGITWVVLLVGASITIAFSSFLRAPSLPMHLAMSAALALSGAIVLVLIIALNNPFRGDFRVSTEPFDRVIARMHEG